MRSDCTVKDSTPAHVISSLWCTKWYTEFAESKNWIYLVFLIHGIAVIWNSRWELEAFPIMEQAQLFIFKN